MNLKLQNFEDQDLIIYEKWLRKDYMLKWYKNADDWLYEAKNRHDKFNWITMFIIYHNNNPIGFCQYYDCSKTGNGYSWDNEPQGTFGIDYCIGEERYLGQGLACYIIKLIGQQVLRNEIAIQLIADPVLENSNSIRALEKNGYVFCAATGLYKLAMHQLSRSLDRLA